jgi:hypothetical protein
MDFAAVRRDEAASADPVPNEGPFLNQAIWSLTAIPALFLALRVYCKIWRKRSLWWDDYILLISWVALLSSTTILSVGTHFGIGLQYADMKLEHMPIQAKLSYAAAFCVILSAAWSKTSFAFTLLRITDGRMRWFVWFIIISVNIVLTVSATLLWVSCWPTKKLFYPETPGTCWKTTVGQNYQTFASIYSGSMDIILALLPWKFLWTATLYKREKIGALIAMSAGIISGIITFMKILVLPEISDENSTTVNLKIYGTAEPAVAIIAASIPVLRAFIRQRRRDSTTQIEVLVPRASTVGPSYPSPTFHKGPRDYGHSVHIESQRHSR